MPEQIVKTWIEMIPGANVYVCVLIKKISGIFNKIYKIANTWIRMVPGANVFVR